MTGRPSKYNNEMLEKAKDYLVNHAALGDPVPLVAGLAVELGISRETVYDWSKDDQKKPFSDIVASIMASQERKLVSGSLIGDLNPTISKLLLCKHGHSERVQNENTGRDGGPIEVDHLWTVEIKG